MMFIVKPLKSFEFCNNLRSLWPSEHDDYEGEVSMDQILVKQGSEIYLFFLIQTLFSFIYD